MARNTSAGTRGTGAGPLSAVAFVSSAAAGMGAAVYTFYLWVSAEAEPPGWLLAAGLLALVLAPAIALRAQARRVPRRARAPAAATPADPATRSASAPTSAPGFSVPPAGSVVEVPAARTAGRRSVN